MTSHPKSRVASSGIPSRSVVHTWLGLKTGVKSPWRLLSATDGSQFLPVERRHATYDRHWRLAGRNEWHSTGHKEDDLDPADSHCGPSRCMVEVQQEEGQQEEESRLKMVALLDSRRTSLLSPDHRLPLPVLLLLHLQCSN